ncbi:MAG: hypothetical protein K5877_01560 [Lachnospiraceae bacterium]|nr:hypothetical protein [Lachnospiraceae bacterium]
MTYTTMSSGYRGLLLVFATIIFILFLRSIIAMIGMATKRIYLTITIAAALTVFVLFQGMIMYQQEDTSSFNIPVVVLIFLLIILLIYVILMQKLIKKWRGENITAMSVKEAVDTLPVGIVFFTKEGIPLMLNESMKTISRELTDEPLTDGQAFLRKINDSAHENPTLNEYRIVVDDVDNKAYSITKREPEVDGIKLYELTATDVSAEYALSKELEKERVKENNINKRLKALMETIDYVAMNRELVGLKTALHDNIGQSILIAKRYLAAPDSVDKNEMFGFWHENIRHLVTDETEEWELPYYAISKEADRLGIHLNILGRLPDEKHLIPVVDGAVSVQIGNTLKHTDSCEVTVAVNETDEDYRICLTNGSKVSSEKIVEGGGLTSLRSMTEAVGGTMKITTRPEFAIVLHLPKEEGLYRVQK